MIVCPLPLQVIADGRGSSVASLLKPITRALDSILDRRLQPIRSITAQVMQSRLYVPYCMHARAHNRGLPSRLQLLQANHAHSVAFVLRNCSDALSLRAEPVVFIADACATMEMSDAAISASASFRGAPVRTDAIIRLRAACLQVLSAAIGWKVFRCVVAAESVQLL